MLALERFFATKRFEMTLFSLNSFRYQKRAFHEEPTFKWCWKSRRTSCHTCWCHYEWKLSKLNFFAASTSELAETCAQTILLLNLRLTEAGWKIKKHRAFALTSFAFALLFFWSNTFRIMIKWPNLNLTLLKY